MAAWTSVEAATASSGVRESLAPSRLAWSTPARKAAGKESERIATYSAAGSSSAASALAAAPTYSLSSRVPGEGSG